MPNHKIRVLQYLNQFFGGIGGEEKADVPTQVRERAVGPGLALQKEFGESAVIVATLTCGDNYFNANTATVLEEIVELAKTHSADVLVAGPAFNAGRYGFACAEVCKAVATRLAIPCVTALYKENPAIETYRRIPGMWILSCGSLASDMRAILPRLAAFTLKVGSGGAVGPASAEGYFPTGRRVLSTSKVAAADRAFTMLLAKLRGQPFQTEIPLETFEAVPPAPPVKDLKTARVAIITTSGLVPKGNPDHFRMLNATEWRKYPLPEDGRLRSADWEVIHGGFNTTYAQANPNLVLPLDALEQSAGDVYGELNRFFYSITGVGTELKIAKKAGQEIASSLHQEKVDAALLVAT